jgi:hypothetical protein
MMSHRRTGGRVGTDGGPVTRVHALLSVAARLAALTATLGLLVATSAPVCGKPTAPVVFRATGTCGPDGLVVVSVDSFSERISLANAAVLGLPPDADGRSSGFDCPISIDHGGWRFSVSSCAGDAGATPGCERTCTVAEVTSGPLQFVCVDAKGQPLCASTLVAEQ